MRWKKGIASFIIILLIVILIIGCNKKKENGGNTNTGENKSNGSEKLTENNEKKIMEGFRKLTSGNKKPFEIAKYIDANIAKVSKENAQEMIIGLEESQEYFSQEYIDELFKGNRQDLIIKAGGLFSFDSSKIEAIEDKSLKSVITNIYDGKYKLMAGEGSYYPIIDYGRYKDYEKYLPDEIKEYIDIKSMESSDPSMRDAELGISWDELGERLLKTENYLKKYKAGVKSEEVTRLYGEYLIMYLQGGDNSPIYDYQTGLIHNEVMTSYKKLVNNNADTISGDIVNKYIKAIGQNKLKIDSSITAKVIELHNQAIAKLEENK